MWSELIESEGRRTRPGRVQSARLAPGGAGAAARGPGITTVPARRVYRSTGRWREGTRPFGIGKSSLVSRTLSAIIGAPPGVGLRQLTARAAGNPLYVRELAALDDRRVHRGRVPDSRHQRAAPAPDTPAELLPDFLADKPSGAFLGFIFFVLEAV